MFFKSLFKSKSSEETVGFSRTESSLDDECFVLGWKNGNNGFDLESDEVNRLISVLPTERQLAFQNVEFMTFAHFGMNTFTDREWGTGKESENLFNPTDLDTDQWCEAIKSSGSKGIILTCKHHDGFCLFQTKYSDHSVKNSKWRNGKGDVLADLAKSCKKYELKLGVYLSPWDMNNKDYGKEEYNEYFCNQLTELLTNYGEIFEVWFDGAKGKNAVAFEYDWVRYYNLIRELQPNAVISVCGPDVRWCGNEAGKTRPSEWNVVSAQLMDYEKIAALSQQGDGDTSKLENISQEDDDLGSRKALKNAKKLVWYPSEVDVSMRKGWFYHKKQDKAVKSLQQLMHIYYTSVGGNASLLLNMSPNKEGKLAQIDVDRLAEMGKEIKKAFADPVVEVSKAFEMDKNFIDVDFAQSDVRKIVVREDLKKSQRVELFDIYVKSGDKLIKVDSGTTIGSKKIVLLPTSEKCDGVRVHVRQSRSVPQINFIGVYR